MKLFLFGGAEIDNADRSADMLKRFMKEAILNTHTNSLLHIPFARPTKLASDKGEWYEGWFTDVMSDTSIQIYSAKKQDDINTWNGDVVFINGGHERKALVDAIIANDTLFQKVRSAKYIIAESAGSMAMGECMRISRTDDNVMKALGILKDVVIEPHYTERNYKQYLPGDMKKSGVKIGIGIDSATGIILDTNTFPGKWEKVGPGNVYILTS